MKCISRCCGVSIDSGYLYICDDCASRLIVYPRYTFSVLGVCQVLMGHQRCSGDLDEKEFFKLKASIANRILEWKEGPIENREYDDLVKEICKIVIDKVKFLR